MTEKPAVLVSACLLGSMCRYNGKGELHEGLKALMDQAFLVPVCPEIYGGLPTPRTPAERRDGRVLCQDGRDVTDQYQKGAEEALKFARLYGCRTAVLKERSPSCGSGRIYDGTYTHTVTAGDGVAAQLLKAHGISVFGESEVDKLKDLLHDDTRVKSKIAETRNAEQSGIKDEKETAHEQ